jgi:predicted permease
MIFVIIGACAFVVCCLLLVAVAVFVRKRRQGGDDDWGDSKLAALPSGNYGDVSAVANDDLDSGDSDDDGVQYAELAQFADANSADS